MQAELTQRRLERAGKLTSGLADEGVRWQVRLHVLVLQQQAPPLQGPGSHWQCRGSVIMARDHLGPSLAAARPPSGRRSKFKLPGPLGPGALPGPRPGAAAGVEIIIMCSTCHEVQTVTP